LNYSVGVSLCLRLSGWTEVACQSSIRLSRGCQGAQYTSGTTMSGATAWRE
jgi:hypothetical protein